MGKATIIEAQNSDTQFENTARKGILGKLKGVFADYKHGTRNADRLYTEQLWDNRVFGSEDVMEALETRTLFGELDHPDGDRCETKAQNAAITITKLEKRPDEGVIYGEAEILDTPTGRILKTLADSGAKLGISSRGMGDEIYENGQNIIDPETYDFITFDVVVTPANKKARVSLTESKHHTKLIENLKKEIMECETLNQLSQIKNVVTNCKLDDNNGLLKLIESKSINESITDDDKQKITNINDSIKNNVMEQKCEILQKQLDESLKASESLAKENTELIEKYEYALASRKLLQKKLKEANDNIASLNTKNDTLILKNTQLVCENKKLNDDNEKTINNKNMALINNKQIADKKIKSIESKLRETINTNTKILENKEKTITNLKESNQKLEQKVNEYSKILIENKELLRKIKMLETKAIENKNKLIENKKIEENRINTMERKINKLTEQNQKLLDAQKRFSKLSFNPVGNVKAIAENFENNDLDQDDIDLFNTLIGN